VLVLRFLDAVGRCSRTSMNIASFRSTFLHGCPFIAAPFPGGGWVFGRFHLFPFVQAPWQVYDFGHMKKAVPPSPPGCPPAVPDREMAPPPPPPVLTYGRNAALRPPPLTFRCFGLGASDVVDGRNSCAFRGQRSLRLPFVTAGPKLDNDCGGVLRALTRPSVKPGRSGGTPPFLRAAARGPGVTPPTRASRSA